MLCRHTKTNPTYMGARQKYTPEKTLIYQGLTKGLDI
tara:strand:+ start:62 stop:172 length:111 start_codon:yes stop_codon:yes gene_type:complete